MADVFVISDLHMGDGGPRDNFAGKENDFLRFLDFVIAQDGELVILGDLFEFWQASVGSTICHRLTLLDRLAAMLVTYVIGNHDIDLQGFIHRRLLRHAFFDRMGIPFKRTIGPRSFKFLHGHEVDPYNCSANPGVGRAMTILAGMAEDFNGSPQWYGRDVEDVMESFITWPLTAWRWIVQLTRFRRVPLPSLSQALTPAQRPGRGEDIIRAVEREWQKEGFGVAIVGHTHQAGRVGSWYYNSGSWVGPDNDFLRIQPDGEVLQYKWTAAGAVANDFQLDYQMGQTQGQ